MKKGFSPIFIIILLAAIAAAGYFGYQYYKLNGSLAVTPTSTPATSLPGSSTPVATADPYSGWNTYTNKTFGYELRYPSTWTVEETKMDVWEMSGKPVEYVSFFSPGKVYMLTFGVRYPGQDLGITTRTGTGAGEFVNGDPITASGMQIPARYIVYQNKVKTVFFQEEGKGVYKLGDLEALGDLDYRGGDTGYYENYDLKGSDTLKTAGQILSSFKLVK